MYRKIPKPFLTILVVVTFSQLLVILHARPADRFHKTNEDYQAFTMTTSTQNENLPRTFEYMNIADWKPSPSVLTGEANIEVVNWRGSSRSYTLDVTEKSIITEPTMNFAGWETTIENQSEKQTITYTNSEEIAGRIAYEIEPGQYTVSSRFTQHTWPRLVGNSVTLATVLFLFGVYSYFIFTTWKAADA